MNLLLNSPCRPFFPPSTRNPRGARQESRSPSLASVIDGIRRSGALATSDVRGTWGKSLVVQIVVPDAPSADKLAAYLKEQTFATTLRTRESTTQGSWVVQMDAVDARALGLWRQGEDLPHRRPTHGVFDLDQHAQQPQATTASLIEAIRTSGAVLTNVRQGDIPVIQIAVSDANSARTLAAHLEEHTFVTHAQVRQSGTTGSWVVQIDVPDALAAALLQRGDHFPHRQRVTARFELDQQERPESHPGQN